MRNMRFILPSAALLLGMAAPALASGGFANVVLWNAGATLTQASDTSWTLSKTGTMDSATSSVVWTIKATQGATVGGRLVANGFIGVSNFGTGAATVGNIVVNLQTLSGSRWVTRSSDIADATHGDAATSAHVVAYASSEGLTLFTENAASGRLSFTDKKTNTVFSLVPEVTIPARNTVHLLYSASFDNKILNLTDGTPVRIEVIVTFGNHPLGGPNLTDANVDINGNGVIDPDEAKVRSVSTRAQKPVPATLAANSAVTLSDTAADLATTGTVAYGNPVFSLGAPTGTATITYSAGASGGSITNCAHAAGSGITATMGPFTFPIVDAFHADACNTQTIQAPNCTPGSAGCGWHEDDMITFNQADTEGWGDLKASATSGFLAGHYTTIYGPYDVFQVGSPSGFTITFGSADGVIRYLPQSGNPGPLDANLGDPTSSASGSFGGEVVALKLNIDYSDAKALPAASAIPFGDLVLCGAGPASLNGMSVRDFLSLANSVLGGGPAVVDVADLSAIASELNGSFPDGTVSTFAHDHLAAGACPAVFWTEGDQVTHTQAEWGGIPGFSSNYDTVYAPYDVFQVGTLSGFLMVFDSANAVTSYLPAFGNPGPLDADLLDPTSSASGVFGGEVVALKLNIDFSDAGFLKGRAGLRFGDLTLCGLDAVPALNGMTVRQLGDIANTLLGGGSGPITLADAYSTLRDVNVSFYLGIVTAFAQQHLVNGACP